jgi:hypothetical protein
MSKFSDYIDSRGYDMKHLEEATGLRRCSIASKIACGVIKRDSAIRLAKCLGCSMDDIWESGVETGDDPMTWPGDNPAWLNLLDVLRNDFAYAKFTGDGINALRRKWRKVGRNWSVKWNDDRKSHKKPK